MLFMNKVNWLQMTIHNQLLVVYTILISFYLTPTKSVWFNKCQLWMEHWPVKTYPKTSSNV